MNKYKQSVFNKIHKRMVKAIKDARSAFLSIAARKDRDSLTAKELEKRFPKKRSRKKEELAKALVRKKARLLRKRATPGLSKRTTPGLVENQSTPAYPHREGARWIKNAKKKTKDQRVLAAHHGKR